MTKSPKVSWLRPRLRSPGESLQKQRQKRRRLYNSPRVLPSFPEVVPRVPSFPPPRRTRRRSMPSLEPPDRSPRVYSSPGYPMWLSTTASPSKRSEPYASLSTDPVIGFPDSHSSSSSSSLRSTCGGPTFLYRQGNSGVCCCIGRYSNDCLARGCPHDWRHP